MHPFRQLSVLGLLLGTLFFAFSLTPSLVPRPFHVQGILSGLSFAAGYWLGFAGRWLWCYLGLPLPRPRLELTLKCIAAAFCLVVAGLFLRQASEWQNSVRMLMEMDEVGGIRPFSIGLIALLVFVVLLLLGRLFRKTFIVLSDRLSRHVPHRVSLVLGVAASVVLFWSVIDGVIFTLALRAADNSYQQLDVLMQDEVEPPEDPTVTGGAESLVSWEALGGRGRRFVTSGPRAAELSDFFGEEMPAPLRVYVGLNAAETPEERAELALQEFKRVGGFDRSVMILATPTGRGWVDPAALDTAEYLHRGDIATVTMQYSYLPSPLSLMVEADYGAESARALFKAIYNHWSRLPADERPRLYLHGLSLGALNSDRSFDVYDIIDDPFDGVLWSGPPFRSETWSMVTRDRDAGTPAWLPTFRDGAVVRFMNQYERLDTMEGRWGDFRIAFLQYASDPVTFFQPSMFYREPAWMESPRGPDVSPELRWYPVVTMLQLVADIAAGKAPTGYGHEIAAPDYIDAWLALTEPEGWSESDLARLRARFDHRR
ncbi:alpha/beta-hydrolase family protein [Methylonatrum kenyense]|uniref:alpha/beta hydrolase n=1 Tax=Methylonatrum kenyense TaxID=455253 RepID=UPI0020BEFD43|nr:alpha/beta-hydrolase family protein [Methylonatrum kenyense]MCK8514777.1 alpha/beta-hydrolase family protein [Methylonatrum kenyense]